MNRLTKSLTVTILVFSLLSVAGWGSVAVGGLPLPPRRGLLKASETIGKPVEATSQGRKVHIRVGMEIGGKLQIQAGKEKDLLD